MTVYPPDYVPSDYDDGTMPNNVDDLRDAVVGQRIVKAEVVDFRYDEFAGTEHTYWDDWRDSGSGLVLTLDNGRRVVLVDSSDCCAYTQLEEFFLNVDLIDHAITGVASTDGYETWHVFADMGDVLRMKVGWSAGNPFYYGYGFKIGVSEIGGGENG